MRNKLLKTTLAIAFAGLSGATWAASDTGSLAVSASVNTVCKIQTGGTLTFGAYDPVVTNVSSALASTLGTSSFSLKCTKGTPDITVGMGNGLYYASSTRNMAITAAPTNVLAYNLYQPTGANLDACAGTTAWDNSASLVTVPAAFWSSNSTAKSVSVCGSIPGGQDVIAGTYNDTVVITVNF